VFDIRSIFFLEVPPPCRYIRILKDTTFKIFLSAPHYNLAKKKTQGSKKCVLYVVQKKKFSFFGHVGLGLKVTAFADARCMYVAMNVKNRLLCSGKLFPTAYYVYIGSRKWV
jgi:predicted Zn-dependent peptidase